MIFDSHLIQSREKEASFYSTSKLSDADKSAYVLRHSTTYSDIARHCAIMHDKKEETKLTLSPEQFQAIAKRVADALEKLSIGSFLYWVYLEKPLGFLLGAVFIVLSLVITARNAKK